MLRYFFTFCLLLVSVPGQLHASTLEYSVKGVSGELKENVIAWLGTEPATPEERSNFLAASEDRATDALKALGYYRPDIETTLDKKSRPWHLTVTVKANEPVRIAGLDIQLLDEAAEDPAFIDLMAALPFKVGDILHHGQYEQAKRQLVALGLQRGYFDGALSRTRVEVNAEELTATIAVHYSSGSRYRFGELTLDESVMDMSWVDSVIRFQSGDLFDHSLLQQLRAELQQTRYFSNVVVRPQLNQLENGRVPITVSVSAANSHSFEFGVGFSTDTEERVSVTWRTPRINRYGHSQETRLEYSPVQPSGRFTYNIPLTHPIKDVLQLSAYMEDREYGDLDSRQKGVGVRREFRRDQWIASYSARTLDEAWALGRTHKDNTYVLPGASLSHKTRSGSLVDPEAGFHQVYLLEGAHHDIGSDINLLRAYSNFRLVVPLAPRHRLVSRAELGAVFIEPGDREDLAPSLSFFAGGSQSIRGFSYQSIGNEVELLRPDGTTGTFVVGGDRLVTVSLEYQYYFTDTWRGAVFADAGDAFDEGEFDGHYGAGFGVHYMSPVGAIRLELANDLSEDNPSWRLHINIGAEF
ncbi:MAG: autotransporter assembly complex family protein [Halioglobus sp.]